MSSEETGLIAASQDEFNALLDVGAEGGQFATPEAEQIVTTVGDYLPFIYLGNAKVPPPGHFYLKLNRTTVVPLGEDIVMLLLAWRPKAMQFKPKVLSFYDTQSEQFQEIQAICQGGSKAAKKNKAFGAEFLCTLPDVDPNRFCTYYLGNPTGRNEAPNLMSLLKPDGDTPAKRQCIQHALFIDDGENQWFGPQTKDYDQTVVYPDLNETTKILDKFKNPPAVTEEVAEGAEEGERD